MNIIGNLQQTTFNKLTSGSLFVSAGHTMNFIGIKVFEKKEEENIVEDIISITGDPYEHRSQEKRNPLPVFLRSSYVDNESVLDISKETFIKAHVSQNSITYEVSRYEAPYGALVYLENKTYLCARYEDYNFRRQFPLFMDVSSGELVNIDPQDLQKAIACKNGP